MTAGSLLFGAIGGVLAAPSLKIGLCAAARLRAAGIFSNEVASPAAAASPPHTSAPATEGEG